METKISRHLLKLANPKKRPSLEIVYRVMTRAARHLELHWHGLRDELEPSLALKYLAKKDVVIDAAFHLPQLDEFISHLLRPVVENQLASSNPTPQ